MGLLQQDKVVFYHPLDDQVERTQSEAWDGTADYGPGKVDGALKAVAAAEGFGAESEFLPAGAAYYVAIAALDGSRVVAAYQDGADSGHGTARVGTVSGGTVAWGAESEFLSAGAASSVSVAALDGSKVVVAYRDDADSLHGTAKVGTVSGGTVAWGAESEFLSAGGASYIAAAALGGSSVVVAYRDNADSGHGTAKVGAVSGTTIAFGAESEFLSAGGAVWVAIAALDGSRAVVAYQDGADSGHGTARIGTVSGTAIAFGAESEFLSAGAASFVSVAALGSSSVVVAYQDSSDSWHGTARVGTVSGTAIAFGAEAEFLSAGAAVYISAAALGESRFVVAYRDDADSGHGTARVGTVSGTGIAFGAEAEFLSAGAANYNSAAALGAGEFAVAYGDAADSGHGTARAWRAASSASSLAGESASYPGAAGGAKVAFCGWFRRPSA